MIETYDQWAAWHARLFMLTGPTDLETLLEWCDEFQRAGYTVLELVAASRYLVTHPPENKWSQLAALNAAIRFLRACAVEEVRRQIDAEQSKKDNAASREQWQQFARQLRGIGTMPEN